MCSLTEDDRMSRRVIECENVTLSSVKSMCQNVLHLLSTTVEAIDVVLWPYLLEVYILVTLFCPILLIGGFAETLCWVCFNRETLKLTWSH